MKQVKRNYIVVAALALAAVVGLQTAQAGIIVASDITNGTNTHSSVDGLVTLNPLAQGLVPGTLGANASLFGVTGGGNNNNIIDSDGDSSTTGDREALDIVLDATVGLSQVTFAWTRANGPAANDGVVISGFLADPGASFSGAGTLSGSGVSYSAGSLYVSLINWSGTASVIDLSNLAASAGQTLQLGVNDSDQTGPVIAMKSVSYDVIPEPATLGLVGLASVGLFIARRFRV